MGAIVVIVSFVVLLRYFSILQVIC